ncbi:MAG: hypothetical protein ABJQ34_07820 [Paracoccaceae bacterium]
MADTALLKLLFKAASQSHLDLEFPISSALAVRLVERPGDWMSRDALATLKAQLRSIADTTLDGQNLDYGVLGDDPKALRNSIVTMVVRRTDRVPIAFNALALIPVDLGHRVEDVLHLGLVMVDPNARQQGLSWVLYGLTCLLAFVRRGCHPVWVSNVTQVPAVIGLVANGLSTPFPAPQMGKDARRSLLHLLLARRIMAHHRHVFGVGADAEFDEDSFVISNAYTGGSDHLKKTFEATAKHRDDVFNTYCADTLNYARGDDILQLGQIDFTSAFGFMTKDVPPKSSLQLMAALATLGLQQMVIPLIQWADTTRDYGILKARTDRS